MRVRSDGSSTGTLSVTRTVWSLGTVDLGAPLPRLRQRPPPPRRAYGRSPGVGRVGRQLARALARGVAGEHESCSPRARSATDSSSDDEQQRQDRRRTRRSSGPRSPARAGAAGRAARRRRRLGSADGRQRLSLGRRAPRRPARLLALQARGRAGVDGGLEGGEVGRDRRLGRARPPTTRRARSGWTSRLREAWLSSDERVLVVLAHLQPPPQVAQAAARRAARRTSGVETITTLAAISAPIALASETGRAEVDDRQRDVRARTGAEHVARDASSRPPRALARRRARAAGARRSRCVNSVSCRWRTEISSATSTRSTTLRR